MQVKNRFNELLARKERIEKRRFTRRQIVEITGVSLSSVQSWAMNTVSRFDALQIAAFCKFLDCSVDDLLVLVEDDESPESKTPRLAIA